MGKPARRLGRVSAGAITLVLTLLLLQVTTASPAVAASISISPSTGPAGSSAIVTGSAFLPLLAVDLCWAGEGCSSLGTTTSDALGELRAGITVPGDAAPGRYTVSACQVGSGCTQTVFDVAADDTTTSSSTSSSTSTTLATTTSTLLGSTTTLRTTTTLGQPASRPPPNSPTTSSPGATTTAPSTTLVTTPTTIPGESADATTGTTEGVVVAPVDDGQPPGDGSTVPFTLELNALTDGTTLYSIPETGDSTEPVAEGFGTPLAQGAESDEGSSGFGFDDIGGSGSPLFRFGGFGIWLGWLLLIIGSFPVVIAIDNARRRRGG